MSLTEKMSEKNEWMPKGAIGDKIMEIAEMLKTTCDGDMTITLGGAHAKGLADELSDIDIYMYMESPKPYEANRKTLEAFADGGRIIAMTKDHFSDPVGGYYVFDYKGTFTEVTTRLYSNAMKHIGEAVAGRFEILPADWTVNGYYTFTYASEISFVKPLWDPPGFIEKTKKIIYPFPAKLKKRIFETFGAAVRAKPYKADYLNAIKRKDLLIVNYNVYSAIISMAPVIYALNDAYFTGDKQLAKKLSALPYCPKGLLENLSFLLGAPDDARKLEKQREILCGIADELARKMDAVRFD